MSRNPNLPNRKYIRLKGYDYSNAGLYFLTICVQDRECLFGHVMNGEMTLNDAGAMVEKWYWELENKYPDKIRNIRGMGLYQGFSLVNPNNLMKLVEHAQDNEKLILLEAGTDSIRFRPTMDVTVDEIRLMLEILDRCLAVLD